MKYLFLIGLPFGLSLVATPLLIRLAPVFGLLDLPDERRKLHVKPVPTAGGLTILAAFIIGVWLNIYLFGPAWGVDSKLSLGLCLGLVLVGGLGLVDDIRKIGPWGKILVQIAGGVVLYYFGFGVAALTHPFGHSISTGWLSLPITVVWVLLICNAINLIDGVDGLAGGIVLVALATMIAVSIRAGEHSVMFYAAILAGSLGGFYVYNFPPAKIFLGDCGSLSLGFLLAAISLIENRKGTTTLTLLVPIVAMGVPLLDTGLAFLRRSRNGLNPLKGDREHLHHRLLRLGLSPRQVVLFFIYASIYLGFSATLVAMLSKTYVLLMVLILTVGLVVAMEALKFLEKKINRPGEED